jgi:hypothetical protein
MKILGLNVLLAVLWAQLLVAQVIWAQDKSVTMLPYENLLSRHYREGGKLRYRKRTVARFVNSTPVISCVAC